MVKSSDQMLVSWQAHEYIQREKNAGWYVGLILIGLALSALLVYLQQWTFLALVVVSVIALLMYSLRPPRTINYSLTNKGVMIGDKLRPYSDFKAFGVVNDGDQHFSIALIPRKRFSPKLTIFFPENQGEKIVDVFGNRLPMQEVKPDFLDRVVKFLRI